MLHIEKHWCAQRYEHTICRNRCLRDHRVSHRSQRTRPGQLGKKDIALVFPHDPHALCRIGPQPFDDALHIGLAIGEQPAFAHHPSDTGIIMAILPGIADPHDRTIRQRQTATALDLQKEEFDIILGPGNLEPLSRERTIIDRRPVFEQNQLGAFDLAADALVFQLLGKQAEVDINQIGRSPVDRNLIMAAFDPGSANLRFEIAGRECRTVADLHGFEIAGEKAQCVTDRPAFGCIAGQLPVRPAGQSAIILAPDQGRTAGAK